MSQPRIDNCLRERSNCLDFHDAQLFKHHILSQTTQKCSIIKQSTCCLGVIKWTLKINYIIYLITIHCCLSNGTCDRGGHYVPMDDVLNGDFETNKKYFEEGQILPGDGPWIRAPD